MAADFRIEPLDDLVVDPATARVYEHGWQSWSPTRLYDVRTTSPRPEHDWQHVMRFRPGTPLAARGFQAEGLLVVDPGNGEPVRTFAAADPTGEVPTLRARLDGTRVLVECDAPGAVDVTDAATLAEALTGFGERVREHAVVALREAPTVWCSWYHYFHDVTEADIVENLAAFDTHDLPVEVVQVDDGWQAAVGLAGPVAPLLVGGRPRRADPVDGASCGHLDGAVHRVRAQPTRHRAPRVAAR